MLSGIPRLAMDFLDGLVYSAPGGRWIPRHLVEGRLAQSSRTARRSVDRLRQYGLVETRADERFVYVRPTPLGIQLIDAYYSHGRPEAKCAK